MTKIKLTIVGVLFVICGFGQKLKQTDLFISGTNQTHTYRIPALEVSVKGTVIAICDARRDDASDLPGNIDLVMRRSFDNGHSWEPIKVILDLPESHGCGDPSLVIDRITGRIFCFYAYAPPGVSIHKAKPGSNAANDLNSQHIQYIYSDDDGENWSEPVELNPMVKEPAWEGVFATSGHGIQTRTGRLIQPLVIKQDLSGDGSFQTHARNIYSDDHGKNWKVSHAAGIQVGETKVVELPDGTIMQNMRNRKLNYRSVSISENEGVEFGKMWQDSTLICPRCNASITRYASVWEGQQYNVMAFSNPANEAGRKNMTVRLSLDNAKTWPVSIPIHDGPSAYSSIIRLYDGSLGLLYETGEKRSNEKVSFVKIEKNDIDSLIALEVQKSGIDNRHKHNAYYYHSSNQFASLPDTDNEIIFLGNSISDGGEWHELFGDSRMKNRGISGDVTEGILFRLKMITRLKPAKIFLLIGINDLARGKSTEYILNNYRKIVTQIQSESPGTQLYVQSILPVNEAFNQFRNHCNKTDSVLVINKSLQQMAEEMDYTFVDIFTPFSDHDKKLRKDLTEDGLHLNGRGYQVWRNELKKHVK